MGKQRLDFIDRKESSGADTKWRRIRSRHNLLAGTYQVCRPNPKAKCSLDAETD